jgi:multicomponent Na+:H+ antiporter subunit D
MPAVSPEWLVVAALAVPAAAAALLPVFHRAPALREACTLVAAAVLALVVWTLAPHVLAGGRPEVALGSVAPGLALALRVEPLGMLFALVAGSLWGINSLYAIGYMRANDEPRQTTFYVCFAVAIAATMGVAFAANLVTLFLFYEVLTLSTYPLVTHKGTPEVMRSGRRYLGVLLGTSMVLLLPAILLTFALAGRIDFVAGGILAGTADAGVLGALLALYAFGIGKAALMPFHVWLPAAMVAPTPVSALLHAVAVVKAGVFTLLKVVVMVFGLDLLAGLGSARWLLYAAGVTVLLASTIALGQNNLKRRLAYSTISQLAYVVLAAALFTPVAAVGAAVHIAAHAVAKITLFFAAGSIYTASHKTDVSQLDGIGRRMPWTMTAFAVGALGMIGVPPAAGVLSKWFLLQGAVQVDDWIAVAVIVVSTALNAAYFLPIVYRAFFVAEPAAGIGPAEHHNDHDHDHGEAPWPMVTALTATAVLTVLLFLEPDVPLALARGMLEP